MALSAILAAIARAQQAMQIAKAFAPMVGVTYDMVREAMPDGSKGEQKMDAFKTVFLSVAANVQKLDDVAEEAKPLVGAAWGLVQNMVESYHTARKQIKAEATTSGGAGG